MAGNGDIVSIVRDGTGMLVKTTSQPAGFRFGLGAPAVPPAPASVVIDPTGAIVTLNAALSARLDAMLATIKDLTAAMAAMPPAQQGGGTLPPAPLPADMSGWLAKQTLVAGGTVRLPSGVETASAPVAVAQTVIGQGMRVSVLDGQGGVGAGHRLAWGKGVVYVMGPFNGQDFGLIRGGKGDGSSDAEAGIRIGDCGTLPPFEVKLLRLAFDDCEDGIFMGPAADAPVHLTVDSCVFGKLAPNGLPDGKSHDMYVAGLSVAVRRSIFYGNSLSNAVKCTGKFLLLEDNIIGRSNNRCVDLPGNTDCISNRNIYFTVPGSNNGNFFGFCDEGKTEINPGKGGSFISTDDTFYFTRSVEYIWINAIEFVVSFIRPKVYWVGAPGSTPPTVQINGPGGIAGPNPFVFNESNRRDALPAMPADPTA